MMLDNSLPRAAVHIYHLSKIASQESVNIATPGNGANISLVINPQQYNLHVAIHSKVVPIICYSKGIDGFQLNPRKFPVT